MSENEVKFKRCTGICRLKLELNTKNFYRNKISKDGFSNQCKNCHGKGNYFDITEENGIKYQICTGYCGLKLELNEDNFYYRNRNTYVFLHCCKKCLIDKNTEYYNKNQEKVLTRMVEYRSKPEIKLKRKKYEKDNNEKINKNASKRRKKRENKDKRNARARKRKKIDPYFRLRCNISSLINLYLKKITATKMVLY